MRICAYAGVVADVIAFIETTIVTDFVYSMVVLWRSPVANQGYHNKRGNKGKWRMVYPVNAYQTF